MTFDADFQLLDFPEQPAARYQRWAQIDLAVTLALREFDDITMEFYRRYQWTQEYARQDARARVLKRSSTDLIRQYPHRNCSNHERE